MIPAKAIGLDVYTGSLSVGKWADMLLLDSRFKLAATMINGKVINDEISGI